MSQENVDLVRRVYDALKDDDLEGAFELMHPDIEYVNPDYAVEPGTRRGYAGIRANVDNMRESFANWRFEPEEFVDAGDQVVVVGTFEARGRDSGAELRRRMSRLWTIRGGRVIRYQWFDNDVEAFQVAGLQARGRAPNS